MKPSKIKSVEDTFKSNLTDCNGTKHSLYDTIELNDGIKIFKIKPSYNTYHYTTQTPKKSICLHFTVGNIKGDIGSLSKEDYRVSVQYVVDRQRKHL